jgi:hypothetical protein
MAQVIAAPLTGCLKRPPTDENMSEILHAQNLFACWQMEVI